MLLLSAEVVNHVKVKLLIPEPTAWEKEQPFNETEDQSCKLYVNKDIGIGHENEIYAPHYQNFTVGHFVQEISEMFWHSCRQRFILALDKSQNLFFKMFKSHVRKHEYLGNFNKS